MKFADIHSHLLPGVDDGPAALSETVATLRVAHRGGTRVMAATPHLFMPSFPTTAAVLRAAFDRFEPALESLRADPDLAFLAEMTVLRGAEHYLSPELLAALESGEVVPLAGGSHLLVEFPIFLAADAIAAGLEQVLDAGYRPVVAHVDRYPVLAEHPARIEELRRLGCTIQMNAGAVADPRNRRLLERGVVDVVASDGHGPVRRSPSLADAAGELERRFGAERVEEWLWRTPRRILGLEATPAPA